LAEDLKSGKMVVEVCGDLRGEVGKLALLNDPGDIRVDKRNN